MVKFFKKIENIGLPPGTVVPDPKDKYIPTRISFIDYDAHSSREKEVQTIEETFSFRDTSTVTWININGMNEDIIHKIEGHFGIHPLVMEDIFNTGQRPKIDDYDNYLFIVLTMLSIDETSKDIKSEQISLVVGNNYVMSFEETYGDVFDPIRHRIREGRGRVRQMGSDYLAYALIDALVDHYFVILERISEEIEKLEESITTEVKDNTAQQIHVLKRKLIHLRKHIWPLREVISTLERSDSKLLKKTTSVFFRDVYDHTIQVIDTIEAFRDSVSGMLDIYLSTVAHKTNDIMKVLTVFASIFAPLTFLSGVYGMNFDFMPELRWKYGYYVILAIMGIVSLSLLIYFRRKKWF